MMPLCCAADGTGNSSIPAMVKAIAAVTHFERRADTSRIGAILSHRDAASAAPSSVLGRPFRFLDSDHVEWHCSRLESQAEGLEGISKNGKVHAAGCRFPRFVRIRSSQSSHVEVKSAFKARPIQDRSIDALQIQQVKLQIVHRDVLKSDACRIGLHAPGLLRFRGLELMPLRVDGEVINGAFFPVRAYYQREPIREQGPQHEPQLIGGRGRRWPRNDVVANGIGPLGTAQNPNPGARFIVRPADRLPQRRVPKGHTAWIGCDYASESSLSSLRVFTNRCSFESLAIHDSGERRRNKRDSDCIHMRPRLSGRFQAKSHECHQKFAWSWTFVVGSSLVRKRSYNPRRLAVMRRLWFPCISLVYGVALVAQEPAQPSATVAPAFEVASIKPNNSGSG